VRRFTGLETKVKSHLLTVVQIWMDLTHLKLSEYL